MSVSEYNYENEPAVSRVRPKKKHPVLVTVLVLASLVFVAAIAAVILTATAVGAAVGPAEAVGGPVLAAAQTDGTLRG